MGYVMKVFLSWSGNLSHKIACIFREWLPSVIQAIQPYVSSEDIDKGARWSSDIAKELEAAAFGVILVTAENLEAPWVNFEAGALSKSLDKANVSPFLFNVKRSEVQGPLLQFQSTIFEEDDVHKLLKSLNNRLEEKERLKADQLDKSFKIWWPELEKSLKAARADGADSEAVKTRSTKPAGTAILEELLELARQQQRIINDPEQLLPRRYLEYALRSIEASGATLERNEHFHALLAELQMILQPHITELPKLTAAMEIIDRLHREVDRTRRRRLNSRQFHFAEVEPEGLAPARSRAAMAG